MEIRLARHTNRLEEIIDFYTNALGFNILGDFQAHDGYDGVFIGLPDGNWHLEFTSTNEPVMHHFDEDDLLVFYPKTQDDYQQILTSFKNNEVIEEVPKNPYWRTNGKMFKDPDGLGIIISSLKCV
jgi:catechol 2,3-dioxygenase-like lactoylglutathione lyase family enzyme